MLVDGEQRFAREPVEEIQISLLRGLSQGFDALAVARNCEECGRRRKIPIPDIVMHSLKMPDALACIRVECKQRVCVEIVAESVAAIEIHYGRARGHIHNAMLRIEGHAGPVVCCACCFPRVGRPGFVTGFAGQRNGVEDPAQFASSQVEGLNVARGRGMCFWFAAADDDQILVDDARCRERDGERAWVARKAFAKVDVAIVAERCDRLARVRIEAEKQVHYGGEDAALLAVCPVGDAASRLSRQQCRSQIST